MSLVSVDDFTTTELPVMKISGDRILMKGKYRCADFYVYNLKGHSKTRVHMYPKPGTDVYDCDIFNGTRYMATLDEVVYLSTKENLYRFSEDFTRVYHLMRYPFAIKGMVAMDSKSFKGLVSINKNGSKMLYLSLESNGTFKSNSRRIVHHCHNGGDDIINHQFSLKWVSMCSDGDAIYFGICDRIYKMHINHHHHHYYYDGNGGDEAKVEYCTRVNDDNLGKSCMISNGRGSLWINTYSKSILRLRIHHALDGSSTLGRVTRLTRLNGLPSIRSSLLQWSSDDCSELICIAEELITISTIDYDDVLSKLMEPQNVAMCKFPGDLLPIIASYCSPGL